MSYNYSMSNRLKVHKPVTADSKKAVDVKANFTLDFKSIRRIVLILSILGIASFIFLRLNNATRHIDKDYYNSQTSGVVYSVIEKSGFRNSKLGTFSDIVGYDIGYYYFVNGRRYDNVEFVIYRGPVDYKFIQYAYDNINSAKFLIRYAAKKPYDSVLDEECK